MKKVTATSNLVTALAFARNTRVFLTFPMPKRQEAPKGKDMKGVGKSPLQHYEHPAKTELVNRLNSSNAQIAAEALKEALTLWCCAKNEGTPNRGEYLEKAPLVFSSDWEKYSLDPIVLVRQEGSLTLASAQKNSVFCMQDSPVEDCNDELCKSSSPPVITVMGTPAVLDALAAEYAEFLGEPASATGEFVLYN